MIGRYSGGLPTFKMGESFGYTGKKQIGHFGILEKPHMITIDKPKAFPKIFRQSHESMKKIPGAWRSHQSHWEVVTNRLQQTLTRLPLINHPLGTLATRSRGLGNCFTDASSRSTYGRREVSSWISFHQRITFHQKANKKQKRIYRITHHHILPGSLNNK